MTFSVIKLPGKILQNDRLTKLKIEHIQVTGDIKN
jgi:hypothetical protein